MESTYKGLAVVAIDFGTTFSGYAYSFTSDPKKIYLKTNWIADTYEHQKTATAILLRWDNKQEDFVGEEFGFDAQNKYAELVGKDQDEDYILVDQFKMDLYSESAASGLQRTTELLLRNGKRIKVITLISVFIEYLKDHFLEWIEKRDIQLNVIDIRWVLTVPAIWTEGAKQLMREAGEMAGLPSSNLTLAFEPEAAALWHLHLSDPTELELYAQPLLKKGTKCLVLDAGGGIVDFTVHEVVDSEALAIKHEASGGPWGGTVVDQKFMEMLIEIFGQEVYDKYAKDHRGALAELYHDFEYKKRILGDEQATGTLRFPIKSAVAVSNSFGNKVQIVGDTIQIDTDLVKKLFDSPCESIVDHTRKLLEEEVCEGVNTILLVGGFGSSVVLQQRIMKSFPKLNVITTGDAEVAVVNGAVLYGHNPLMVRSRIARYTYGTDGCMDFVEGEPPEHKKVDHDGIANCKDIFAIHVTKGQTLPVGQSEQRQGYTTVTADQTAVYFNIYASTEKTPQLVTDDSCTYIGKLTIDMPDTTGGLDRGVFIQMSFGETEMVVTATEEKTGESVSATLNFLG